MTKEEEQKQGDELRDILQKLEFKHGITNIDEIFVCEQCNQVKKKTEVHDFYRKVCHSCGQDFYNKKGVDEKLADLFVMVEYIRSNLHYLNSKIPLER